MQTIEQVYEDIDLGFRVYTDGDMFSVEERVHVEEHFNGEVDEDWVFSNAEFFSVETACRVYSNFDYEDGAIVWRYSHYRVIRRGGPYVLQRVVDGQWLDGRHPDPPGVTTIPTPPTEFKTALDAIRYLVDWE